MSKFSAITSPRLENLFHGPLGPVPAGSDVEYKWETDWGIQRGKAMLIKGMHRVEELPLI